MCSTPSSVHAGPSAWLGLAYVSLISMFLGFFAWYAGLARGEDPALESAVTALADRHAAMLERATPAIKAADPA